MMMMMMFKIRPRTSGAVCRTDTATGDRFSFETYSPNDDNDMTTDVTSNRRLSRTALSISVRRMSSVRVMPA